MTDAMFDEVSRCRQEITRLTRENERLSLDGIHTCHAECQRPLCKLTRERDALRQIVQDFPPIEAELQEVSDRAHRLETQRDALLEALRLVQVDCQYLHHEKKDQHALSQPCPVVDRINAAIKAVEGEGA